MTALPPEFQFSQSSLQDYFDCPRRFELRYLLRVQWPALRSEPVLEFEHRAELGRRFHEMVYQSILGVPEERIAAQATDPELAAWWEAFVRSPILNALPAWRRAEFTLSAPFGGSHLSEGGGHLAPRGPAGDSEGYRLTAKYDLLAIDPGRRLVIVDWKTAGRPQQRATLANRLQTRVYPFLLVEAGRVWNSGQPPLPEQIEMIYWFTNEPSQPVHFHYSAAQCLSDRETLTALVREIAGRGAADFPLTLDEKRCLYCEYRSLCNRGTRAGVWDEAEGEPAPTLDLSLPFEQIGEIEF
jgi:hypothetical protein